MLRKSTAEDIEAIMELWLIATLESHDFISAGFWWQHQQQLSAQLLENAEIWLNEKQGKLTGFFALNNRSLTALYIHPDEAYSNLKYILLHKAKSLRPKLQLHLYSEEEESLRFYLENGFHITKQQVEKISGHPELVLTYSGSNTKKLNKLPEFPLAKWA